MAAGPASRKVFEDLLDTEVGTITKANIKSYYQAYKQENYMSKVSFDDYIRVLESYYRNSAIAGEA